MRTITLDIDGGPMVVDIYDPPSPTARPPLLLIHGWGGSGRYWKATVDRLGNEYSIIVPDLPGVGRSLPVRGARNIFNQAAAVEALIDHLGIGSLYVVGHSMGAAIAILFATRRPALIPRLVLTAVSFARNDSERNTFLGIMSVASVVMRLRGTWMADVPWLVQQSAQRYFYRVPDQPDLLRAGFIDYLQMDHGTAIASARSAVSPAIVEAARSIRTPTLFIFGRQDQAMPTENADYTAQTIPGSQMRWIEECGHLPMVEHPDEYVAIVRGFLEG